MLKMRRWQEDGLRKFQLAGRDFLAVATPGAGKTTFALRASQWMIEGGEIGWVIVIVPTDHLKRQWEKAAARLGIKLNSRFANSWKTTARDYDGVVSTYQSVAKNPGVWREMVNSVAGRCLVILDEVHHAGDAQNLSWGPALIEAFSDSRRRLLLSGTPFRTDARPIPFVRYDEGRRVVPDVNYDYGMALQDLDVVRPVVFPALDGEARWRQASDHAMARNLSDTDSSNISHALSAALDPKKDWIQSAFNRANEELSLIRRDVPDTGGLVVASNGKHARAYAEILEEISGGPVAVVLSDKQNASKDIFDYASGSSRWMVAVQMVAEGVDIPRLGVLVYATRVRTELFFRQVVGRCIRRRGEDDDLCARIFIPTIEPLLVPAAGIEMTVHHVLREEEENVRNFHSGEARPRGRSVIPKNVVRTIEVLGSSASVHRYTINSGEKYGEPLLNRARTYGVLAGLPVSTESSSLARFMRLAGVREEHPWPEVEKQTLAEKKMELRNVVKRKVGRLAFLTREPHRSIYRRLHALFGEASIENATEYTLNERLVILDEWIANAGRPVSVQSCLWGDELDP
ncbi:DEAD/DEAH box helicase [Streptomyces albidoflavus]|uniref:DEAD/DEAH box helicase n=1 Tax=Streptomyces albidoflavus TaxID=1886 RepID=UPI0013EEDEA1|nr:DEAD/DEAH box helicase family protein [Streptomyces albidoflavus]